MTTDGGRSGAAGPADAGWTFSDVVLLLVLAAIQFTLIIDFVIVMPLGPAFKGDLSLSNREFSLMVSAYGFSAAVTGLLAARLLDLFDRKTSQLVLYAGFTAGTFLCAVAPTYPVLVVGRALAGGFAGVMSANLMALVGDVFPERRRATAMGVLMSAFSVASIVGIPAGVLLANRLGWRAPFAVLAFLCLPVLALAWRVLPPIRGHLGRHARDRIRLIDVLLNPTHLRAYALGTALILGSFTIIPFLTIYLVNNVGRSMDEVPFVWVCGGLATLLTTTPVGMIADRFGKLAVFRVLAVFCVVPVLLITNLPPTSLTLTLAVTTLFMVCTSARMVPAMAMITGSAAPNCRGSFMSVNSSVQQTVMAVAPILSGFLLGEDADATPTEPLHGFPLVGLVAAAAMLVSAYLAGRLRRGADAVPAAPAKEESVEPALSEAGGW